MAGANGKWSVQSVGVLVGWAVTAGLLIASLAMDRGASATVQAQHTRTLEDHEVRIRNAESMKTDIATLKQDAQYTKEAVQRIEAMMRDTRY